MQSLETSHSTTKNVDRLQDFLCCCAQRVARVSNNHRRGCIPLFQSRAGASYNANILTKNCRRHCQSCYRHCQRSRHCCHPNGHQHHPYFGSHILSNPVSRSNPGCRQTHYRHCQPTEKNLVQKCPTLAIGITDRLMAIFLGNKNTGVDVCLVSVGVSEILFAVVPKMVCNLL